MTKACSVSAMIVSHLKLKTDLKKEYVLAVISDLHNHKAKVIISSLSYVNPDYIKHALP